MPRGSSQPLCAWYETCEGEGNTRGDALYVVVPILTMAFVGFVASAELWHALHNHLMMRQAVARIQEARAPNVPSDEDPGTFKPRSVTTTEFEEFHGIEDEDLTETGRARFNTMMEKSRAHGGSAAKATRIAMENLRKRLTDRLVQLVRKCDGTAGHEFSIYSTRDELLSHYDQKAYRARLAVMSVYLGLKPRQLIWGVVIFGPLSYVLFWVSLFTAHPWSGWLTFLDFVFLIGLMLSVDGLCWFTRRLGFQTVCCGAPRYTHAYCLALTASTSIAMIIILAGNVASARTLKPVLSFTVLILCLCLSLCNLVAFGFFRLAHVKRSRQKAAAKAHDPDEEKQTHDNAAHTESAQQGSTAPKKKLKLKTVVKAEVKLIHAQKHAIAGGQARDLLRQKLDFTMDVQFENLGLKLRSNGLQVLRGVTGRCASGRITAIMGPSGAGKVGCQVRASVCAV